MTASEESTRLIVLAAKAAAEKKAENIIGIDVSDRLYITDAFVIASADNERQVQAIAESVEDELRERGGVKPRAREGYQLGRWILMDFDDIVVHVMHDEDRAFYALERLWKDCPTIELPEDARGLQPEQIVSSRRGIS